MLVLTSMIYMLISLNVKTSELISLSLLLGF